MLGESIQSKIYPEQEYQNRYTRNIYIYMHSIFYDIKAKYGDIYDLGHL